MVEVAGSTATVSVTTFAPVPLDGPAVGFAKVPLSIGA
jgi:hypothetical protein